MFIYCYSHMTDWIKLVGIIMQLEALLVLTLHFNEKWMLIMRIGFNNEVQLSVWGAVRGFKEHTGSEWSKRAVQHTRELSLLELYDKRSCSLPLPLRLRERAAMTSLYIPSIISQRPVVIVMTCSPLNSLLSHSLPARWHFFEITLFFEFARNNSS